MEFERVQDQRDFKMNPMAEIQTQAMMKELRLLEGGKANAEDELEEARKELKSAQEELESAREKKDGGSSSAYNMEEKMTAMDVEGVLAQPHKEEKRSEAQDSPRPARPGLILKDLLVYIEIASRRQEADRETGNQTPSERRKSQKAKHKAALASEKVEELEERLDDPRRDFKRGHPIYSKLAEARDDLEKAEEDVKQAEKERRPMAQLEEDIKKLQDDAEGFQLLGEKIRETTVEDPDLDARLQKLRDNSELRVDFESLRASNPDVGEGLESAQRCWNQFKKRGVVKKWIRDAATDNGRRILTRDLTRTPTYNDTESRIAWQARLCQARRCRGPPHQIVGLKEL